MEKIESIRIWLEASGGWVTQVFVVVFLTLIFGFIIKRLLAGAQKRLEKTNNPWDDALIVALKKPASGLIWIVGIGYAAEIVKIETQASLFSAVDSLRDVGVIIMLSWFLIRLIKQVERNLVSNGEPADESKLDQATIDAIGKLLRISVLITTVLVLLQTLGYSISGVLAFGGIGGIAIGFAAKDLLANFFGGAMIYLDRPFSVGDWIRSPDREIEGTVEQIGWRLTRIRTFDKRPLYIPNSVFANISVQNPSRMSHRRIKETIGIRYDDANKMDAITREVKAMLLNHPAIDHNNTLMVNFNSFAPSSLDFFIYTFTKTTVWTEYHEIKHEILLKINKIISDNGAEIAFPTSTMHVPNQVAISTEV